MKALTNRRTNAPKLSRLVRLKRISRRKRRARVDEEREIKVLAQQLIAGEVADRLESDRGLVKMTKKQLRIRDVSLILFGAACALIGIWLGKMI